MKQALVIGGTGPTGPFIVEGLVARGYEPVILHRGSHEVDFVADFEHLHADPHFEAPVRDVLEGRTFDLTIAAYGRLRLLVEILEGRTRRLVTIGGTVYERQPWSRPADETAGRDVTHKLVRRVQETEDGILRSFAEGKFVGTHVRYPNLYGPRQLAPREWSVIRRILDGRTTIPVLDGGLTLESRAYVENAAHAVLLCVDQPVASAGRVYHVADMTTPTDGERALAIAEAMGAKVRLIDHPPTAGLPAYFWGGGRNLESMGRPGPPPTHHKLLDTSRIRRELGYRDVVDFEEAIRRTVRWYVDNPLESGGDQEERIGDPFDYEGEDAYVAAMDDLTERCTKIPFAGVVIRHSYDHPSGPSAPPGAADESS
ncbi:MAG: NAD-dependent epimerase/dehydratase family protein [Acidimicrobiales bacterium]